jgi:glutathione S-transferase
MDYIAVKDAIDMPGLRLVLTAGAPGPWSESAKAILQVKNIDFIPVQQDAGGENLALQHWTAQTSAPVAIYNNEAPRSQSLDILFLAERLDPTPALIPADANLRAQMFGLIREIIGEQGFAWNRRLLMLQPLVHAPGMEAFVGGMASKYGYSDTGAALAPQRCVDILSLLSNQLLHQQSNGSPYFIGSSMTALDIYWANFASMLNPLPAEQNPMNSGMRRTYESLDPLIAENYHDILLEHRDYIYQTHLTLPLDF